MIEAMHLFFSYGARPVLRDFSASFAPGLLYGIVGPNGCGKTTLIRLLCGLSEPREGALSLDATPYSVFSSKELARKVSLMPQIASLPPISGEELVGRGRYPYWGFSGRMSPSDLQAVQYALQRAEASSFAHRDVTKLSGGERQRICLAMLLAQDTPYVLLDEPTTYLDISHRFALMEQMRALREEGKCVIAVLHDLSLALRYCDRILVLEEGMVQSFDTPENILSSGVLDRVFSLSCRAVEVDGKREYLFLPKE